VSDTVAVRVLVLADTHLRPDRQRSLPAPVWDEAARADVVLHAGDVLTRHLLDDLAAVAPVHAVLGNNDATLVGELPEMLVIDLAGVPVAMVHDAGSRAGRAERLHRRFPGARVVVYGHSHLPDASPGIGGQLLFNPGSCTERRRAPERTYGILELEAGRVLGHRIVSVTT
jgi:uncharacterized protein